MLEFIEKYFFHFLCSLILLLIGYFVGSVCRKEVISNVADLCILDSNFHIISVSPNFLFNLDSKKEDTLFNIKKKFRNFENILESCENDNTEVNKSSLSNDGQLLLSVEKKLDKNGKIFEISLEKLSSKKINFLIKLLFENASLPISLERPDEVISSRSVKKYEEIKLPMLGYFVVSKNLIYRQITDNTPLGKLNVFCEFMLMHEWLKIEELANLQLVNMIPITFFVTSGDKIEFVSDQIFKMFHIKGKLNKISDFFDELRGKILPDSLNYQKIKTEFSSLFKSGEIKQELFFTLDKRVLNFLIYGGEKNIIACYDVSHVMQNNSVEEDTINLFLKNIEEMAYIFDDKGKLINSNSELIGNVNNIEDVKTLFSNDSVSDLTLNNGHRLFLIKRSISDKVWKLENRIRNNVTRLVQLFSIAIEKFDASGEYKKYLNFMNMNIENVLQTLNIQCTVNKNASNEEVNIFQDFEEIFASVSSKITIKDLSIHSEPGNFTVIGNRKIFRLLLESLLLICFEYQFEHKTLWFFTNEKNVFIKLSNIQLNNSQKLDVSNLYSIFDFLDYSKIFPQTEIKENKLSICFRIARN